MPHSLVELSTGLWLAPTGRCCLTGPPTRYPTKKLNPLVQAGAVAWATWAIASMHARTIGLCAVLVRATSRTRR